MFRKTEDVSSCGYFLFVSLEVYTLIMSTQEMRFKALVSEMICCKLDLSEEREKRLLNFYNHAEFYYEVFCESVYILQTRNNVDSLSLDDFGYTHFNYINTDKLLGYALLTKEDIVNQNDDIILYIELALKRLEARLHSATNVSRTSKKHFDSQKAKLSQTLL